MFGGSCTDLLLTTALLLLNLEGTHASAEAENSSLTLPSWRPNSEYVTRCVLDSNSSLLCDWTRAQTGTEYVSVSTVESEPLRLGGEACLEFWYLLPEGANGSALRALLKTRTGPVEIWTSPALQSGSWRQVFVPLAGTEAETRVSLEAVQELSVQGRVAFDRIGVRKGQCGNQCEPGAEFWTDGSTRCLCSAGRLSCSFSQCPEGQNCGPITANSGRMTGHGTCTVHTDPQCSTFDGALFRFMAPCTYVLAQTCAPTQDLPMFSVEVVSGRKGNSSVSAIQQVNVELKGLRVSLLKRQTHRAIVNGIWRKLPMVLDNGTVEIHSNPAAVMIETDFGLFVSYDNTGAVQVTVPASYDGKVCGMCGNFNHRGDDDYLWPDGLNATALAPSQQTEATSSCEITLVPHKCDPGEMSEYSGEPYCGGLISGTGPFSGCLAVVGAESYFRSCVSRMCGAHGNMAALCETLQAYADICQEAGVDLPAWRNSTLCPLVCGENSHYSACAEACPEVCAGQDLPRTCGSCEERCECDSGYKLSGGRCVLTEDCGCWKNGQHYKRGAMFLDGECDQQCRCMGNNEVHCTAWHCADNEVCMVEEGVKGCFLSNPATCRVYGDPHYITLDGKAFDFQGGCNYTLATACGDHSSVQFTVTGRNHNPFSQNLTRSKLEAVGFQVEDVHIILNQSGTINMYNSQVSLPYSTNGIYGSILVYRKNQYIVLETSFGLRLTIDGWNRLFLQVDERHKGGLCGLCGTYSDDQSDDFTKPDGKQAGGAFEFGNSWRVMEDSTLCNSHPDDPRSCDADEKDQAYSNCSALLADAFTPCHDPINPDIYMTSCVYDYCATGGDRHTFCSSLESYAVACKVAEVALPNWQEDTVCACPLSCNFDNDLCGWQQLIQDTFDWRRQSGPTPSNRTGPNQDHTTGASFYMYIEGDSVTYGDSARMLSPKCHYSGPLCLSFWYHMYGSAKAMALNIYKLQDNKVTKLWWDANDQGQQWHLAFVDIKARRPFQIIAEGIRGSNTLSDVAIDDISMHFGSCSAHFPGQMSDPSLPPTAGGVIPSRPDRSGVVMPSPPNPESNMTAPPRPPVITTAIPQPPVVTVTAEATFTTQLPLDNTAAPPLVEATTDSIVEGKVTPPYTPDDRSLSSTDPNPVCKMNCDFDQDLCAWNQLLTDVFDWTRNNGSTPTELTGPSSDHTNGNGHYLYIEANSATHGDTARLLSAECSDSGPQCLQFWYHMYGSADTMGLHVYLLQDSLVNAVWRSRNDQGNMWHLAQVDLTTTGPFQIIFEGRRGSNDQSDVAIDDVSLHRGRCADLIKPTTSAPPTNGPPTTENPELLPVNNSTITQTSTTTTTQPSPISGFTATMTTTRIPASEYDTKTTTAPQVTTKTQTTAGSPTTAKPDVPVTTKPVGPSSTRTYPSTTIRSEATTTAGPRPPISNRPHPQTTATPENSTTDRPQPSATHDPQKATTARTQPPTMTDRTYPSAPTRPETTTVRPQTTTTTKRPQPPTTARSELPTSVRPQPPTTEMPQSPNAARTEPPTTARPQSLATQKPGSLTTTQPEPPTNAKPQTPTTTGHEISTSVQPQLPTTVSPQNPATETPGSRTTIRLNHPTTARPVQPHPSTTARPVQPHPSTTARPVQRHPSTTARPQFPTTARPLLPTTEKPQPTNTASHEPLITTSHEQQTTAYPTPSATHEIPSTARSEPQTTVNQATPATTKPPPPTTAKPQLPHTAKTHLPITSTPENSTTVRPRPASTETLKNPTTGRSQPPLTEVPGVSTTETPQPASRTIPLPQTTYRTENPTTISSQQTTTAKPQPTTTTRPQLPTTVRHQPSITAKPQPTTTARPQSPTTVRPQLATTTRPQSTTIAKPQSTTIARPQPSTTARSQSPTTVRPQPATTARPQPTSTAIPQSPITVGPQLATTTRLQSTTVRPQPTTTARSQSPTTARPQAEISTRPHPTTTARPQPPTTETPQPATTTRPQSTTTARPQPTTTGRPQPPTTVRPQSTATARPQPTTTARPKSPTTVRPQPATTTRPQPTTTARPQPSTTTSPHPTTIASHEPHTTAKPQPETTAKPQQPATIRTPSTTTIKSTSLPTVRPEPTTTTKPQLATTTSPESLTTLKTQPPTMARPGTQSTVRPQPTTEQPDIPTTERKQPPATEKPGFPSTKRPGTPSTAGPQPPTTPISTPSCPENSHYTACVPACQPTCEHLHGPSDCTGNEPCTQGCVCDDGFVLKMRVCVPIQQCGCVDRNGNKHTFNEVWYTNHCSQKCKCEEDDGMGKIDCDDKDECDGGTVCLQDEMGHYHCSSMGFSQCTIRGEPEYRTFDDMKHKFEGEHSYVLVQTTGLPNNLPEVYVEGINAHTPDNRRGDDSHDENSSEEHDSHRDRDDDDEDDDEDSNERRDRHRLRQLKIRVYNHTVEFRKNRKLVVDGRRSHGSVSPSGGLKIRERSSRIYLKTDFGLSVEFDGSSRAEIILPHAYKRKVGGLCGNFDGRKKNDLMKPDGSQANSVAEFGESWRVTEDSLNINWRRTSLFRTNP